MIGRENKVTLPILSDRHGDVGAAFGLALESISAADVARDNASPRVGVAIVTCLGLSAPVCVDRSMQ